MNVMSGNRIETSIPVLNNNISLTIIGDSDNGVTVIEREDATEHGEATIQLWEGCFYQYKFSDKYQLQPSEIVSNSKLHDSEGRLAPNIFVGTLSLVILDPKGEECGNLLLEVQSKKTSYRDDYRQMLGDITEICTDLLLQHSSPVSQPLTVDFNTDAQTLYQRFAFIKSILESDEFGEAVNKIVLSPVTKWEITENEKDIRSVRRFDSSSIRQLAGSNNRIALPHVHPLKGTLDSIPRKIIVDQKIESVDTPENRFIKFALYSFLNFIGEIRLKSESNTRVHKEAALLESKLQNVLSHSFFKKLSKLYTIPQNSPVLQRKEGYREVFRAWLMFDLAARLIWKGGEDVYGAGKKDIATLYEYWLFFKLADIIEEVFGIGPIDANSFIEPTKDGLLLQLVQGKESGITGVYNGGNRKLNVSFTYNRTFSGGNKYPDGGSWTKNMRPDYTLSIWPEGISEIIAEREELITHLHFDAKYKVKFIDEIFGTNEDFEREKEEQRKGTYKRADLLKMHAYKDAIRRTSGSYILYPGNDQPYNKPGFHELIPGLGAFTVRPSKSNDGTFELKKFLREVINHFMNRASQRERYLFKTFETFVDKPGVPLKESLPESIGKFHRLIPDDTFVLIGYCRKPQFEWILDKGLYNTRLYNSGTLSGNGSIIIDEKIAGAKYLLLHMEKEVISNKLFRIVPVGPRIFSKEEMVEAKYPSEPKNAPYLVFNVVPVDDPEFEDTYWNVERINGFEGSKPIAVSLTEVMKAVQVQAGIA